MAFCREKFVLNGILSLKQCFEWILVFKVQFLSLKNAVLMTKYQFLMTKTAF